MTMDINSDTGRITFSYEHLMGKAQPAHQGSQSSAPDKEDAEGYHHMTGNTIEGIK